jgi:hypothetical protein
MDPNVFRLHSKLPSITLAKTRIAQPLAVAVTLLLTAFSIAQETTPPADSPATSQVASANNATTIGIPAGTRIALVLTQPVQTRYLHHGDDIYAQVVSPVTVGNEVAIPPGTFVQGKIDKIEHQGGRGDIRLLSMSITFPDGYTIPVEGPMTLESPDGYAWKDPGNGRTLAAFALPAGGAGLGALIGHFSANSSPSTITSTLPPGCIGPPPGCLSSSVTAPGSTAKGTIIGATVGGAIGAVASIALLVRTHNFFLDVSSPVEMVLQHALTLPQDEVADAVKRSEEHPAAQQPVSPRPRYFPPANNNPGTCYTPGTPGTPDTDIPGTPAIGDSPGTPSIHIPGIPAIPPTPHPCP